MRKHEAIDLAPASFLSLRLAQPTTGEPHNTPRAIDLGVQSVKLRPATSLSAMARLTHARLPCAHQHLRLSDACPGPGRQRQCNFIPNRDLMKDALSKVRTSHSSRNERNRHASRQPKFHSDRFACFRHSFFCWKGTSECRLEVVLWKSSRC